MRNMYSKLMVAMLAIVAVFVAAPVAKGQYQPRVCCGILEPWLPTTWTPTQPIMPPSSIFPVDSNWEGPLITFDGELETLKNIAIEEMRSNCVSCSGPDCANPIWLPNVECVDLAKANAENAMANYIKDGLISTINQTGRSLNYRPPESPLFFPYKDMTQVISRPQTNPALRFIGEMVDLTLRASSTTRVFIRDHMQSPIQLDQLWNPDDPENPDVFRTPIYEPLNATYTATHREIDMIMLFGYDTSGHWQDLTIEDWVLPQPMWQFCQTVRGIWLGTLVQIVEEADNSQILSNPYVLSTNDFNTYQAQVWTAIEDAAEYAENAMFTRNVTNGLPACISDWNGNGGVDGSDVSAFYDSWDLGQADVNQDGGTDGSDISVFFECWENSHCFYENGYAYY